MAKFAGSVNDSVTFNLNARALAQMVRSMEVNLYGAALEGVADSKGPVTVLTDEAVLSKDDGSYANDVVNAKPSNEKGAGTKAFLDYAATRNDYQRIALPLANGIMMMVRKGV